MYKNFFHLREAPFSITPDPRFLYMSQRHQEALAHLLYGTGEEGGFVQLTGEVGTGKTTLVRALLESQLERVDVALILNPRLTAEEFVASICDELGVEYAAPASTLKPLIDALNAHLLKSHTEGRQTVLIVDEAQNLDLGVLEQVRLLTNLETSRHKLLRIILVGQPELQRVLDRHDMRQLAQRINARYHLDPLDREDVAGYVAHRMRVAGGDPQLFTATAVREIHRRSGGVPRLINVICDRALLGAYASGLHSVPRSVIRKAAREALGAARSSGPSQVGLVAAIATTVALLIGVAVYLHLTNPHPQVVSSLASLESKRPETGLGSDSASPATEIQEPNIAENQRSGIETDGDSGPLRSAVPPATPTTVVAALDPAATGKSARPKTPGRNDQTAELPPTPNSALVPDGSGTFPPVVKNETAEPTARPDPLELPAKLLGPMPLDRGDPHMLPVIEDLPVAIVATVGDRDNLFRNLYSLWDESLSEREFAEACAIAASRDMHCLEGQAEWNELANWNRPAILELELRDGKPRPVLLQALEGDRAVVDLGFGPRLVHLEQLQGLWNGRTTVLWRPRTTQLLMRQGTRGEPVRWLRRHLDILKGSDAIEPNDSDQFDAALELQVREFQAGQGLVADGVVGPRTMLILNNLEAVSGVPTLVPIRSESAG